MKAKGETKNSRQTKKETDTEMLARLVVHGFERMDKKFAQVDKRFVQVDKRFAHVDKRFDQIDGRFEQVEGRLSSLEYEQKETNRRLDSIERKQIGILESLDETVHRKEFQALVCRVDAIEGKKR